MKIMVVTTKGFSSGEYTGGSGEYINGIYKHIPYSDYLKISNVMLYSRIKALYPLVEILNYIRTKRYIVLKLKNANQYDVIHSNKVVSFPKIKGVKVVTTIHHLRFKQNTGSNIINAIIDIVNYPLETMMMHNSDYLITDCEMMKNKIIRYYSFPRERILVIPLGVDAEVYYPRDLSEGKFILFPNALRSPSRKGLYFIMPVLKKLLDKYNLKCVITGAIVPEGKKLLNKLGDRFKYIGFVDKNKLAEFYNKAMVVIFPSLHEGYGLVPLEVMASGGVVVSADVGAVKEYLKNGVNGYILPLIREEWLEAMEEIIENSTLRENIRKNNRYEKVRSWKDCAEDYLKFFEKIMGEKNL